MFGMGLYFFVCTHITPSIALVHYGHEIPNSKLDHAAICHCSC